MTNHRRMLCSVAFGLVFGSAAWLHADTVVAPAVTLETCGDVNLDELRNALAVEYQGEDTAQTAVTIACEGLAARVRVVGPSHPRGRIADLDLSGVAELARPRTIALFAAEIWSAPAATIVQDSAPELPALAEPVSSGYRSRFSAGISQLSARREVSVGGELNRFGYADDMSMTSLHLDWPFWSRLGIYADWGRGQSDTLRGNNKIGVTIGWERFEFGLYAPIWRERLRVDVRLSAGGDEIYSYGAVSIDNRTLLPDYDFAGVGVDVSYALRDKLNLLAWGNTYSISMWGDRDFVSGSGLGGGLGATYELHKHLRADLRGELRQMRGMGGAGSGQGFSDQLRSLSLELRLQL